MTEGVGNGRLGVEGRFVGVGSGRRGCGDVEVEEVERRWVVYEGTEDQGDSQWAVCRRREGCWWTSHVLYGKCERRVKASEERRTSSNLALPPGVTRTG